MCVTNISAKCRDRLWNADYVSPFTPVRKWERGEESCNSCNSTGLVKVTGDLSAAVKFLKDPNIIFRA